MPHRATVYAQLVESEQLWSWAQLQPMEVDGCKLLPPPAVSHCAGAHSVCDIQLSQVPPHRFTPLGPLCTMFRSDAHFWTNIYYLYIPNESSPFSGNLCLSLFSSLPPSVDFSKPVSSAPQSHSSSFPAQSSGRAQVVLSWWDIDMDPSGSIVCSMAPSWTYPDPQSAPVSAVGMSWMHMCDTVWGSNVCLSF